MMQELKRFTFLGLTISVLASLNLASLEAAPNERIGRLFTSAFERDKLDLLRQNQALKVISPLTTSPMAVHTLKAMFRELRASATDLPVAEG